MKTCPQLFLKPCPQNDMTQQWLKLIPICCNNFNIFSKHNTDKCEEIEFFVNEGDVMRVDGPRLHSLSVWSARAKQINKPPRWRSTFPACHLTGRVEGGSHYDLPWRTLNTPVDKFNSLFNRYS